MKEILQDVYYQGSDDLPNQKGEMMRTVTIKNLCTACGGSGVKINYAGMGMFPYYTNYPCEVCMGNKMITVFEKIEIDDTTKNEK
jgi:DnaJ-class molecular chaperone